MARLSIILTIILSVLCSSILPAAEKTTVHEPPEVRLLEAGEGPKRELRIGVKRRHRELVSGKVNCEIRSLFDGEKENVSLAPTILSKMQIAVTSAAGGGDIRYKFYITEAKAVKDDKRAESANATSLPLDQIRRVCRIMESVSGSVTISRRGQLKKTTVRTGALKDPESREVAAGLLDSFDWYETPLPAEAVGQGARWKVVEDVTQAEGHDLRVTSFYTLEKLEEHGAIIRVTIKGREAEGEGGKKLEITLPGSPSAVDATLISASISGTEKLEVDTRLILARRYLGTHTQKVTMRLQREGEAHMLTSTSKIEEKSISKLQ